MSKRKKAPSGNPANRGLSFVDRSIARDFERWLAASDTPLSDPHNAAGAVGHLFDITKRSGLDILEPSDTADIADMLLDIGPNATGMVDLFHDYVHFRLETSRDPRWHQAHDELEDVLDDNAGISAMLESIITDAETRDPAVIADALAHTKVIDGVTELLDWIGTSRPITDTGALRLSDIEPAAAALGLRAAGARTLPATGDLHGQTAIADGITYVQSMWHLDPLAAWWRALLDTDVLELTASRVRPGRASQHWRTEPTPPLDVASEVAALVVSDTVLGDLPPAPSAWDASLFRVRVTHALAALIPDAVDKPAPRTEIDELFVPRVERDWQMLADLGLAEPIHNHPATRFVVPEALRGVFATGLLAALAEGAESFEQTDDIDTDADDSNPFADPALRARMAELGVVHKPGMAAELLSEMAPLLAEEGIDLENGIVPDLETLNAALARATERRNLERFTPVGDDRQRALTVLRLTSDALHGGNIDLARALIESVPPEPEPASTMPAVSHVIGAGLGTLDTWATRAGTRFGAARMPHLSAPADAAAEDILRRASHGRAFDSLSQLIARYRGKLVLEATVVAVAAGIRSLADTEGTDVQTAVARYLTGE